MRDARGNCGALYVHCLCCTRAHDYAEQREHNDNGAQAQTRSIRTFFASIMYAFLISVADAFFDRPNTVYSCVVSTCTSE